MTMKMTRQFEDRSRLAFTLIELLTVITIMGIVAALVVTMGQAAAQKKKITATDGEKHRLMTLIDSYHSKLNYYPPDNGALVSNTVNPLVYDAVAATNQLIYELIGATNVNGSLSVFNTSNSTSTLSGSAYQNVFNRGGIANADSTEPHNFFQPGPSSKEIGFYSPPSSPQPAICGLLVPVELTNVQIPNFWHYDSSTTNRHNLASYDLWAEFSIGNKSGHTVIITNGNW